MGSSWRAVIAATIAGHGRWRGMPSSVIADFSYDPRRRALAVRFVSGRRYRYHRVPPAIVAGLRRAASKGRFFNACIRDRFAFTEEGRKNGT